MSATRPRHVAMVFPCFSAPEDGPEALRGAARRLLDLSPAVWCRFPDTLVVEIGAVLHLHASEEALVARLSARLEHPPRTLRIGVADQGATARTVALLASDGAVVVVPPGGDRAVLGGLHLDDLDLTEESRGYLRLLGFHTLGEVTRGSRGAWERRLSEGARIHALVRGEWGPDETRAMERILAEEQRVQEAIFDPPVTRADIILFRLRALLDASCADLLRRAEQIGALGLRLLGEGGGFLWEGEVRPAAATRDTTLLITLARPGIDALELTEPVGSLQVELREVRPEALRIDDLFWQSRRGEERWRHLSERLAAAGDGAAVLFRADLSPNHLPERSFRWVHATLPGNSIGAASLSSISDADGEAAWLAMAERGLPSPLPDDLAVLACCRPTLFLDPPEALGVDPRGGLRWRGRRHGIAGIRDLGQVETDWWRAAPISRRYRALRLDDGGELFAYQDQNESWWLQGVFE